MGNQELRRTFKSDKARKFALACRIAWLVLALCVIIAAFVGIDKIKNTLLAEPVDDGLILPNVYVADVKIGGMTQADAIRALQLSLANSYATDDLVVTLPGDSLVLTPGDSGAQLDVEAAVKKAYEYGRNGTDAQNAKTRKEAQTKNYSIALLPYLNLDLDRIYSKVEDFCQSYSIEMTQPSVYLEGDRPEYPYKPEDWNEEENGPYEPDLDSIQHQTLVITLGTPDFILEPQALYNYILDAFSLHKMEVSYEAPTLTEPDQVDLAKVFETFCSLPLDAELDGKTFAVTPEVYGYGFDAEAVSALLSSASYGQQLRIPMNFLVPDITAEALVGHLFKDILAEYISTTGDAPNSAREANLQLACEALNGYVVKAGETFSFNMAIGPCTTDRGYQAAPAFSGSTASILGGGISQIASALYCSALMADLQITQRASHGYAVDYALLGFDAAISYGTQDLQFINTTQEPIRIIASVIGNTVSIQLLGTLAEDAPVYRVELKNQVLAIYNPNTIYQPMSQDNQQGYTDGYILQQGITGYDVETYVYRYDVLTGALVSSKPISSDHYEKRDHIVVRIEGEEAPPVVPTDPTMPTDPSQPDVPVIPQ